MNTITKTLRIILIALTILLAITAIPGGIMLLANFYAPPVEQLNGTIFKSFTIPGLALAILVGGSALTSTVFLLKKSKFGIVLAAAAGVIIMFFEFVEVLIIGSPAGPSRLMQIGYFGLGTLMMIVSLGSWFLELRADQK